MSCSTTTMVCLPREGEDEGSGLLGLAIGHAGDRLVEQQELLACISSMPISSHCFWPWLSAPASSRLAPGEADRRQGRGRYARVVRA